MTSGSDYINTGDDNDINWVELREVFTYYYLLLLLQEISVFFFNLNLL